MHLKVLLRHFLFWLRVRCFQKRKSLNQNENSVFSLRGFSLLFFRFRLSRSWMCIRLHQLYYSRQRSQAASLLYFSLVSYLNFLKKRRLLSFGISLSPLHLISVSFSLRRVPFHFPDNKHKLEVLNTKQYINSKSTNTDHRHGFYEFN